MEAHDCPLSDEDVLQIKENYCNKEVILNMQEDIHSLKADIKDIKDALLGDGFNPGFKQRIEKVETDTDKNTVQLNKIKNYGATIVFIIGIMATIFGILSKTGIL